MDPADAAVAARSFARRWGDVSSADRAAIVRPQLDALAREAAAALVRAADDLGFQIATNGGVAEVAPALAAAVESTGPDRWRDPASVTILSQAIDEAGAAIRRAERLVEDID